MRRWCITLCLALLFFFKFISYVFSSTLAQKRVPIEPKTALNLCLRSEPLTLDPRKNSDGMTAQFLRFLYDGLTQINENNAIELALASKIETSEDFTEYTVYLKQAYWSSGEKIVAADFKRSWLQVLDPEFGAYNPDYFFNISNAKQIYLKKQDKASFGVEILDETAFKIYLEHPDPYFKELLSNKLFFPVHRSASIHNHVKTSWVFSGPFTVHQWNHQNKIVLERNPYYVHDKPPQLETVECVILEQEHLQHDLFDKGQLDWVGPPFSTISLDSLECIRKHVSFVEFDIPSLYHFTLNTELFPLNHPKIRKALALSIDRKKIINHLIGGNEKPAFALLPLQMHGLHLAYFQDHDIHRGRRLFQEALVELGMSLEEFPELTLKYPSLQLSHLVAQAVQQQWKEDLGIQIALQSCEWHAFLSDINHKNYAIAALGKATHVLDPLYFLSQYQSKHHVMNRCGYDNRFYAEILERAKVERSLATRELLLHQAESVLMEDMPIIPLFFQKNYCLVNQKLKNFTITPFGEVGFRQAHFE